MTIFIIIIIIVIAIVFSHFLHLLLLQPQPRVIAVIHTLLVHLVAEIEQIHSRRDDLPENAVLLCFDVLHFLPDLDLVQFAHHDLLLVLLSARQNVALVDDEVHDRSYGHQSHDQQQHHVDHVDDVSLHDVLVLRRDVLDVDSYRQAGQDNENVEQGADVLQYLFVGSDGNHVEQHDGKRDHGWERHVWQYAEEHNTRDNGEAVDVEVRH